MTERDAKDYSASTCYQGTKNCSFHSSKGGAPSNLSWSSPRSVRAWSRLHSHPVDLSMCNSAVTQNLRSQERRHAPCGKACVTLNFEMVFSAAHCRLPIRKQYISLIWCPAIPTVHLVSFLLTFQFFRMVRCHGSIKHCWVTFNPAANRRVYLKPWDDFTRRPRCLNEENMTKCKYVCLGWLSWNTSVSRTVVSGFTLPY